jgi:hypothetical protein
LLFASVRLAPSLLLLELLELSVDSLLLFSEVRRGRRLMSGVDRQDEVDIVTDRLIRGRAVGGS